jgi:phosphoribosylformimino-5-aminoimidazole carboxamide ribotide isomerase
MQLIPAIDLKQGHCVRLLRGEFDQETRYDLDPNLLAQRYLDWGARWLHVVDLDGAQSGERFNGPVIERLASIGLKTQVGGGIRSTADLKQVLQWADRAVVGSMAIQQPAEFIAALQQLGSERITLAVDVKLDCEGVAKIVTHGWQTESALTLDEGLAQFVDYGLVHVLCTDVARDGAMQGPNTQLYRACIERWPQLKWQASGGVRAASDLEQLAALGASAAIAGKALLEDRIPVQELVPFLPNA